MSTYSHRSTKLSILSVFIFALLFITTAPLQSQDLDVPYVPTPNEVVEKMLDLADVQSSDYVIDLGSGDGRIVIAAAKRGASGHGIDLDPERIAEARENAQSEGLDDRIMFMEENLFDTDFTKASVITMYLLPSVNEKLRPELLDKMEPGTRIVSHSFSMGDWKADKKAEVSPPNSSRTHDIYFWIIPAKVAGEWSWSSNGTDFDMNINQQFQEISVRIYDGNGSSYNIQKQELTGDRITLRAVNGDQSYILSGQVTDGSIEGIIQHHNGDDKSIIPWSASLN
ncbi:SAM-dependent methyltransferase [Fodinibius salsisoli]|uniref:Methyltransferase domain-containing protein n=1 Tax=Fodinibius salsisoli TaxID=2820877 RepID=A0ABT3PMW9_9BACT|nr:class I SAM-dependent methyltransferase [Fodinibius salsisoli]MCW9707249.1 methyltransferase domain-containing protein [Fodinibius salsisoli]